MNYKIIARSFFAIMILFVSNYNLVAKNNAENPPIIKATLKADVSKIKQLINSGADINQRDNKGYTALIWACSFSSNEMYQNAAKLLIAEGSDVNAQANDGNTAIIEAAGNSPEIFNLLVKKGANVTTKKADGTGALYYCLANIINYGSEITDEHKKMINYLFSSGASADEAPISGELKGFTLLIFAARGNELEIAKLLIEHGANVNAKNVYDQTPLSVAKKAGHTEMINLLKSHGAQ